MQRRQQPLGGTESTFPSHWLRTARLQHARPARRKLAKRGVEVPLEAPDRHASRTCEHVISCTSQAAEPQLRPKPAAPRPMRKSQTSSQRGPRRDETDGTIEREGGGKARERCASNDAARKYERNEDEMKSDYTESYEARTARIRKRGRATKKYERALRRSRSRTRARTAHDTNDISIVLDEGVRTSTPTKLQPHTGADCIRHERYHEATVVARRGSADEHSDEAAAAHGRGLHTITRRQ